MKKIQKKLKSFQGSRSEIRLTGDMRNIESDESLASRAAKGESSAFRELLDRHYDRVFRTTYSLLRNHSDAEDVTQDVWAALPKKLRSWRGDAKFTSWLYRVSINAAKDAIRRKATRNRATEGYAEMQDLSRGADDDQNKRISWLNDALGTLSDDLRETAHLTLGEELNFAEAAELLGVAEGTIAWRMSEIRRRLKTLASNDNGLGKEALA